MKKVNGFFIIGALVLGVFIGACTTGTASAKDVNTKIISMNGDTLTVQDKDGKIYKFDKAEDDTDTYNIDDEITVDVQEHQPRGERFEAVSTEQRPNGDIITEYNNGSWSLYNDQTGEYNFMPVELGDWSYNLDSKEDLNRIIETYKSVYENGYF